MKYLTILLCLIMLAALLGCVENPPEYANDYDTDNHEDEVITIGNSPNFHYLPEPALVGDTSVEEALASRRSRRNFQNETLSLEYLSQILWAAYGITEPERGLRTTPSAGATYPLEIYVVIGNVSGIDAGVYRYDPHEHKILEVISGDVRDELSAAALNQSMIQEAPITVVYTAVFSRIEERYGERGRERYVFMEIGHSAQNIYLQAEALGLGTCAIGAFTDSSVRNLLDIPAEEDPLYFLPVGYVR
jgi:SagB-type dehydrogenase family enzyme